jgi:hypothetical protein
MVAACSIPVEAIPSAAEELRSSFRSGKTKSLQWRISQLKAMEKMLVETRPPFLSDNWLDTYLLLFH